MQVIDISVSDAWGVMRCTFLCFTRSFYFLAQYKGIQKWPPLTLCHDHIENSLSRHTLTQILIVRLDLGQHYSHGLLPRYPWSRPFKPRLNFSYTSFYIIFLIYLISNHMSHIYYFMSFLMHAQPHIQHAMHVNLCI